MTGMMWFDDEKKSLAEKVQRAADYYWHKYGRTPNVCQVHPADMEPGADATVNGIRLEPCKSVRKNHLLIGVVEAK